MKKKSVIKNVIFKGTRIRITKGQAVIEKMPKIKKSTKKEWKQYYWERGRRELADKIYTDYHAPITSSVTPCERHTKFQASPNDPNVIVGHWCEDDSPYTITVPEQLRDRFVSLLNTIVEQGAQDENGNRRIK